MHKAQQVRERDAILAVIRPAPATPPDPIVYTREKIAKLEADLAEAKRKPTGRAGSDPQEQKNLQAITYIEGAIHWEKRHLVDLENAEQAREELRARAGQAVFSKSRASTMAGK